MRDAREPAEPPEAKPMKSGKIPHRATRKLFLAIWGCSEAFRTFAGFLPDFPQKAKSTIYPAESPPDDRTSNPMFIKSSLCSPTSNQMTAYKAF